MCGDGGESDLGRRFHRLPQFIRQAYVTHLCQRAHTASAPSKCPICISARASLPPPHLAAFRFDPDGASEVKRVQSVREARLKELLARLWRQVSGAEQRAAVVRQALEVKNLKNIQRQASVGTKGVEQERVGT